MTSADINFLPSLLRASNSENTRTEREIFFKILGGPRVEAHGSVLMGPTNARSGLIWKGKF